MKNNKIAIIYTVKNKITGEAYVGATTNSMQQRKLDHIERANRGEKQPFAQAIATYGADAFMWEQTDTASDSNELARKEKETIKALNSKTNGYNADAGGGFKKSVYQYSVEDGSLLNTYDCLENASKSVGVCKNSIGNTCIGQNKTCKGFYWSYDLTVPYVLKEDLRKKKVHQYNLKGDKLSTYKSVAQASKLNNLSKTSIARACRGERKQSGGYLWSY
ncbi:NUMOD1 domain-containing DNA-binding protein [Formosa sp. PL04]|uniref:NUMOD1 domain-containing DNA-binding protein n=1 Tax=Formosa sp. PL04 TaxID=3081755 RepID=UPI002981B2D6|nr:NUMOD1 domain-containing DNA-binding protein [Formosa sp. PL04]MDW5289449.1 NUMOD1 domain-containing DNA-binding protein [Formosa sp. PL04]